MIKRVLLTFAMVLAVFGMVGFVPKNAKAEIGLKLSITPQVGVGVVVAEGGCSGLLSKCDVIMGGFKASVGYKDYIYIGTGFNYSGDALTYLGKNSLENIGLYNSTSYVSYVPLVIGTNALKIRLTDKLSLSSGVYAGVAFYTEVITGRRSNFAEYYIKESSTHPIVGGTFDLNYSVTPSFQLTLANDFAGLIRSAPYDVDRVSGFTSGTTTSNKTTSDNDSDIFYYSFGLGASYSF
ncbi:MAG: hypothetical protein QM529_00480 [Hydrotalea sp.]|nr:hypothetical protein [Hydrotalea sp.]